MIGLCRRNSYQHTNLFIWQYVSWSVPVAYLYLDLIHNMNLCELIELNCLYYYNKGKGVF